jgi:hypothetical protein
MPIHLDKLRHLLTHLLGNWYREYMNRIPSAEPWRIRPIRVYGLPRRDLLGNSEAMRAEGTLVAAMAIT